MGTTFLSWSLQNRREHRRTAATGRIITAPVTRYDEKNQLLMVQKIWTITGASTRNHPAPFPLLSWHPVLLECFHFKTI